MKSKQDYLDLLIKQVKFPFDHKAIRKEYAAHIEDCVDNLMEDGLVYLDAEEKAVEAMGDPIEAGQILNKIHNPILGWIHFISKFVLIGLVIVLMVTFASDLASLIANDNYAKGHLRDQIPNLEYTEHRKIEGEAFAFNTHYMFTDVVLTNDNKLVIFYETKRINKLENNYYMLLSFLNSLTIIDSETKKVDHSKIRETSGIPDKGLAVLYEKVGIHTTDFFKNEHILVIQDVDVFPKQLVLELDQKNKISEKFTIDLSEVTP